LFSKAFEHVFGGFLCKLFPDEQFDCLQISMYNTIGERGLNYSQPL